METKQKKKTFNIIMVVLIAVVVICGIAAVGLVKGWFGGSENELAKTTEISGIVNIERNEVAYTLEENTALKADDIIETKGGSRADIEAGKDRYVLSENTEVTIAATAEQGESISPEMSAGELFAVLEKNDVPRTVSAGGCSIAAEEAVFSVNTQTGSTGINVFAGQVSVKNSTGSQTVKGGERLTVTKDKTEISDLKATALNDFNIENVREANADHALCFSNEKLDKVVADREQEVKKAAAEQKKHENQVIAAGEEAASGSSSGNSSGDSALTCTIQIRCDTILDNMGDLKTGKEKFVPANGIILATSTVEFTKGETAFDVLKRACSAAGIQLEYAYTPAYGSNYIEGINNLYEFDCGSQSGWTYKINGWFPNYGSSGYKLKKGDVMVWCYTCKGAGVDVGTD